MDNADAFMELLHDAEKRAAGLRLSRVMEIVVEDKKTYTLFRATAADISTAGMRVISGEYLPKGSAYMFTLRQPAELAVRGEIRWIEKLAGSEGFRAGVLFAGNALPLMQKLEAYVRDEMKHGNPHFTKPHQ